MVDGIVEYPESTNIGSILRSGIKLDSTSAESNVVLIGSLTNIDHYRERWEYLAPISYGLIA